MQATLQGINLIWAKKDIQKQLNIILGQADVTCTASEDASYEQGMIIVMAKNSSVQLPLYLT